MRPAIDLVGVEKRFGGAVALQPTTLSISAGKTTALIGRSGSGKSTILRLIIGLIAPTSGEVRIDGEPVAAFDPVELRRRMGYVIQEGGLFPHLTVRGNVLLLGRHLKKPAAFLDRRLCEVGELVRLPPDLMDRYPAELSGGQRQRVGLMRALLLDPEMLLLDEPMGALDPLVRAELQDEFREIFERLSPTVVLVTHDLPEAAYLADRLVLLDAGRVVQEGGLDDFRRAPAAPFVTAFLDAQRGLPS
ncbi:MAG TPA: ATP-binding cassette domain-containing protein [Thermoanaerobaculia bacterium]|nr:ATP-binding cassette domain-containing protein [Thermoanaerobaculia bacterium]